MNIGQEISFKVENIAGKGVIHSIHKLGVAVELTTDFVIFGNTIRTGTKNFAVFNGEIDNSSNQN